MDFLAAMALLAQLEGREPTNEHKALFDYFLVQNRGPQLAAPPNEIENAQLATDGNFIPKVFK